MPAPEIQALLDGRVDEWLLEVTRKLGFQGGPAMVGATCRYRFSDEEGGRRCFVGLSIPDDAYDSVFEGTNADDAYVMSALGIPHLGDSVTTDQIEAYQRLGSRLGAAQRAHDASALKATDYVDGSLDDAVFADIFPGDLEASFPEFVTATQVREAYQRGVNERQIANDANG